MAKIDTVNARISVELGSSILTNEISDYTNHINLACRRMYQAVPIETRVAYTVIRGTHTVDVSSLINEVFTTNPQNYYFLGVIRADFLPEGETSVGEAPSSIFGFFDECKRPTTFGVTDPLFDIYRSTMIDINYPDIEFEYDEIQSKLRIIAPDSGTATLILGFGYEVVNDGTATLAGVQNSHLNLVAKLAAEEVLRETVYGRSAVSIGTADYSVDVSALDSRLSSLEEQNQLALVDVATPVIFFA